MIYYWILALSVFCITTFGLWLTTLTVSVLFAFIISVSYFAYNAVEKETAQYLKSVKEKPNYEMYSLFDIQSISKKDDNIEENENLSGSEYIDHQLSDILDLILRDYVYPWYDKLSDDEDFPYQLNKSASYLIYCMSKRLQKVDFLQFVCTQLTEEVAKHIRIYRKALKSVTSKNSDDNDLVTIFFQHEQDVDRLNTSHANVCLDESYERKWLRDISEAILYHIAPENDFKCRSMRILMREIIANKIIFTTISMLSNSDYVNQLIIWLCSDYPITNETFLTVLRSTKSTQQLNAVNNLVNKEIMNLRSRDSGESESRAKQQLSSLIFLSNLIKTIVSSIPQQSDRSLDFLLSFENSISSSKNDSLSLKWILESKNALPYFIDYLTTINCESFMSFYINIDGWRQFVHEQMQSVSSDPSQYTSSEQATVDHIRDEAKKLYSLYISQKPEIQEELEDDLVNTLAKTIQSDSVDESWFDETQNALYKALLKPEKGIISGFGKHESCSRLITDLEMKAIGSDLYETPESAVPASDFLLPMDAVQQLFKGTGDKVSDFLSSTKALSPSQLEEDKSILSADIIETGLVNEAGKTFGVYAVSITRVYMSGKEENWHVYKRYSDFYDLYQRVKDKYPELGRLSFPAKKTFHNADRRVLEKRMMMLNQFIHNLLKSSTVANFPGIQTMVEQFLEQRPEDKKALLSGQIVKTVDNLLFNPLKAVGNVVKTVPDNIFNTVDGVMDNISKVLGPAKPPGRIFVDEDDDNMPMRAVLLLLAEVFEVDEQQQWLRKRFVMLLQHIVRASFGHIVNRRFKDYVTTVTDPYRVSLLIAAIKNNLWPDGVRASEVQFRDTEVQLRTLLAAKCALLSSVSDELKHLMGSEVTRRGIYLVVVMLQHKTLNKRLIYVLLSACLLLVFPNFNGLIDKLHKNPPLLSRS
ncbi:sorting nexin-13 [Adelges cooleyi]|uniref:sorting nexin-13 n=1 Tax=Adelges cooleyi TaxID=133065 RepID=UPI00217F544F|nr:sorting nexin-13 [Adelges cooleyi]XP_050429846.1 sorting nexin-13 [Adelges cooleyi]